MSPQLLAVKGPKVGETTQPIRTQRLPDHWLRPAARPSSRRSSGPQSGRRPRLQEKGGLSWRSIQKLRDQAIIEWKKRPEEGLRRLPGRLGRADLRPT
jgi:hypothetical protein